LEQQIGLGRKRLRSGRKPDDYITDSLDLGCSPPRKPARLGVRVRTQLVDLKSTLQDLLS